MSDDIHAGWSGWDELKILQEFSTTIWQMYVSWFTWSLGANLLAMSYIITKPDVNEVLVIGLGSVMILSLLFAIIGGVRLRNHFLLMVARARSLYPTADYTGSVDLLFGEPLARYLHWAIPSTLSVILFGWIALIVWDVILRAPPATCFACAG